ncbi:putative prophage protein [Streptococcus pneumoniae]|nr:putative prophage protein [Streptococcus pneumoniae]
MATNRTISVNTSEHDVLLTARKNHPAVFVDGMFLDGVERVEFTNHYLEKCEVVLTFNDRVENNPFPLNEVSLLEKLFGQASNGQSLRDIVLQTLEDGN